MIGIGNFLMQLNRMPFHSSSSKRWIFPAALFLSFFFAASCSESPKEVRTVDVNPLVAQGKYDEAINEITRVLAEYPNNNDLLFNLATIQRLQGNLETAQRTLSKVLTNTPTDDDANFLMVEILIDSNRIQEAWDRFNQLNETYRQKSRAQHTLGVIYSLMRNWQNAENCFRASIQLGDNTAASKSALAFVTCKQDRLDEGKAYLLEAETSSVSTPESMSQIAECNLLLEQAQKARDIALKLTQQFPNDARYWSLLGRASMKLLNFPDSENAFIHALACPNSTPWIQVYYAEMLFASQREREALTQASDAETRLTAMKTPITDPAIYNILATLYAKNGEALLARRFLNRSMQIDPNQTQISEILRKFSAQPDTIPQLESQPHPAAQPQPASDGQPTPNQS